MDIHITAPNREFVIKDTHRGLWYEDGKLIKSLTAGRYRTPRVRRWYRRTPNVECVVIDLRTRELTIKGQEILTSDKVAIRVNILGHFVVVDPEKAVSVVENYEERLYSDIQLAARRSLASMSLDDILTNRNRLSDDILHDVKESASEYGVSIQRADVKDLIFPGNLQEIMNRVLTAERNSQAQLVEARTKSEVETIAAKTRADTKRIEAESEAELVQARVDAEARIFEERQKQAAAYERNPVLLKLAELEALRDMARNANAQITIGALDEPTMKLKSRKWPLFGRKNS